MISKAKIKLIHSLENKKGRCDEGLFVAEGPKIVADMMTRARPRLIVATTDWAEYPNMAEKYADILIECSSDEFCRASLLKTPQSVLALFAVDDFITKASLPSPHKLSIALDTVQDPGNLGTIIRIADWFGIEDIFLGEGCADPLNPKVVQATMGSLARVNICQANLVDMIRQMGNDYPIYGTTLDGRNIYKESLTDTGLIVMGNEGNGISQEIKDRLTHKLYIPNNQHCTTAPDSLNVAVATAITCAEFRRRQL